MADAEEAGLVHVTYNAEREPIMFFCNCCPCCCVVLRALKQFKTPYIIARSNFVAVVEEESCTGCGVCAEERCPMEAIVEQDGTYRVLPRGGPRMWCLRTDLSHRSDYALEETRTQSRIHPQEV